MLSHCEYYISLILTVSKKNHINKRKYSHLLDNIVFLLQKLNLHQHWYAINCSAQIIQNQHIVFWLVSVLVYVQTGCRYRKHTCPCWFPWCRHEQPRRPSCSHILCLPACCRGPGCRKGESLKLGGEQGHLEKNRCWTITKFSWYKCI